MTPPAPRALRCMFFAGALAALLMGAGCAMVAPAPAEISEAAAPVAGPSPLPPVAVAPPAGVPPPEAAAAAAPPPRGRLDSLQDDERIDLWQRLRDGFRLADVDGELVRKWEQWYARDPAYVQRMTERGSRFLFYIVEEVQRRGMPGELALLPFIESAYNPQATSRAAASGMWQFMPATGKDFELRQNVFRDDRRDVLASTRAALDYLQRLNTLFGGDWPLALAAYNWGPGNVQKAMERNRRARLATDYASLKLPVETREYLPKLQAVKNIVLRPEAYALTLPPLGNHPHFLSVAIEHDIDVAVAAELAGMTLEAFQQLNPQMNKPVILAAGTPQVLLPYDNANRFVREVAGARGPLASWTAWVAPHTLKPAEAAKLVGMDEVQLREINLIPERMLVKAGSTLLVPRPEHATANVDSHLATHAMMALTPEARPMRRVSFKAGRQGDSVAAVARRYGLVAAQVAQWNGVTAQARFKPGHAVVVLLPVAAARASPHTVIAAAARREPPHAVAHKPPHAPPKVAKAAAASTRRAAARPVAAAAVAPTHLAHAAALPAAHKAAPERAAAPSQGLPR